MSQRVARVEEPMTPDEYLGFERAAEIRHEYHDGELIAFAGAKREHILITGNTHYRLTSQLAL